MENLTAETAAAALLVVILCGLALYFAARQVQVLRKLRTQDNLAAEDRRYHRAQAWRRLIGSGLMLLLAVLLVGSYLGGQEGQARQPELVGREPRADAADQPTRTAAQRRFLTQYSAFWLAFTLVLFCLVGLALFDVWAIRRFAMRHYRRIQADRRDMLERQVAKLRSNRNGSG